MRLSVLGLAATSAFALDGTDNAANTPYADGWQNLDNGGTTGAFLPWNLTSNNNNGTTLFAGYFIGPSTAGTGDIDTGGNAFVVYANPAGAFANASRDFATALNVGQTFSIDIGVNFRNGNKGFSLESATGQVFNFNVGSDDYQINGTTLGASYSATAIFNLSFTQTTLTGGTYSVVYGANTYNGIYGGIATGLNLYVDGTDNGSDSNNLYFNNLALVPEPSTYALLAGPVLLGAWFFVRRRRSA